MELQSGLGLLIQQYKALLKKNIILSWRNRRSTIAQLLSPFFFVFLLYAISQALANQPNSVYDPQPLLAPPIPPCEDKFFITLPCFDFAWSGNDTALVVSIVDRIMNNNPARPIPPNKVKSFRTKKEVDEWLYNNPTHCPGALHFAAMTMMGLYDTAYWLSWLKWETLFALFSSLLTVLCGMMFQFPFFTWCNSFAIVFLVFFLFQFSMIGFAFMLSTVIQRSSAATTMGF